MLSNQFPPSRARRELVRLLLHRNTLLKPLQNEQQNASKAQLEALRAVPEVIRRHSFFISPPSDSQPPPLASPPFITWKGI
jgi:hypothetical protein